MHQFRSRISVVLLLFLLGAVLPAFLMDANVDSITELIFAYLVLFGSIGLVLIILLAVRYEVSEDYLVVKLGPYSYIEIKVSDIKSVERSYNPLSSPASSLKRLHVKAKNNSVLISPANEQDFFRVLTSRNGKITINVDDSNNRWWKFWNWDL